MNMEWKPSRMNILYFHQHFAIPSGTSGTRSFEFARRLTRRQHEVTIVCGQSDRSGLANRGNGLVDRDEIDGIHVEKLRVPYSQNMSYTRRSFAFLHFTILAVAVGITHRDADLIIATSTPLTIGIPAMIVSLVARKPFVFEVRDEWPEVPIRLGILCNPLLIFAARCLEYLIYGSAEHIVTLSPDMKAGIVRRGVEPSKVTVVPNACDNDLFDVPSECGEVFRQKHNFSKDQPLVVYAGSFGYINGLDFFVQLAHRVKEMDDHVIFLMVGAGKQKDWLVQLASDSGVLGRTLWILDAVPRSELPAILSAATVAASFVIPNPAMWANSANKFFDALASGTPVIINHGGWQKDVLEKSGAGFVLDVDDVDSSACKLVQHLRDREWLLSAGQAARKLAKETYARDRLAEQWEKLLVQIFNASRSTRENEL